jgi:hypothetical protein
MKEARPGMESSKYYEAKMGYVCNMYTGNGTIWRKKIHGTDISQ